ncbi:MULTISPECIES: hypothetical protein [Sphingomonas]|uniref:Uncharacterized protein n=1 Tax=Sphingomonas lycopersici TaxID=2951807 RepID=A0AA41Z5Y0_9SPHN|nr:MULTISPECIES: hypothetical protein [Sphingomonas]MCW6530039.1 hypothetical protein [Sphingomonas lycopersici]MCW6534145.1 hypothetical protein [Sphingomonas lycopersici]OJU17576.1 MAG: hypothetical protein BGN95_18505 [Sphingomonas sp. 66-10]
MSEYEQDFREIGLVLRGFERSIDAALADGCDLLKAATVKSNDIGIAAPVSQPIIASLFGTLELAMKARNQASEAHLQLKEFRTVIRKGPSAFGDCCSSLPTGVEEKVLRAVA